MWQHREALASPLPHAKLRLFGQLVWPQRYFDDRSGSEELGEQCQKEPHARENDPGTRVKREADRRRRARPRRRALGLLPPRRASTRRFLRPAPCRAYL